MNWILSQRHTLVSATFVIVKEFSHYKHTNTYVSCIFSKLEVDSWS